MIYEVIATNPKNETLHMLLTRPDISGVNVKKITGISPIGADIYTTPFGVVDGGLFSGARVPEREIVMTLGMMFVPMIEDSRRIIYNFFRIKDKVNLFFRTDTRYIQINGWVKDVEVDIFTKSEEAIITIVCVDPWFYSANKKATGFHGVRQLFTFPFSNDSLTEKLLVFGEISIDTRYFIEYGGDISVGFDMTLSFRTGNLHNVYLYNMDTRERMNIYTDQIESLTGTPLEAGDEIAISTRTGSRSAYLIRDGIGINAISIVGKNSDWFQLSKGTNVFAFASDYGAENIDISMTYQDAYAGI